MTKEQKEVLKKYEKQLNEAYNYNMFYNLRPEKVRELNKVYNELFSNDDKINYKCGKCVKQMLYNLGKVYFKKEEINNDIIQQMKEIMPSIEEKPKIITKKQTT